MTVAALALMAVIAILLLKRQQRSRAGNVRTPPHDDLQQHLDRERAATAERQRIFQDLHDDLGAKLLDLVYGAESPQQADRAREALQILRDVVSRARREPGPLARVLDEIRAEAVQRLAAANLALDWQQTELPEPLFDQAQVLHLHRIVREAVSNALRHSHAQGLRVRISASVADQRAAAELVVEITDDGLYAPAGIGSGTGTSGMRERAAQLQGEIHWDEGTRGGTKVVLRVPLRAGI